MLVKILFCLSSILFFSNINFPLTITKANQNTNVSETTPVISKKQALEKIIQNYPTYKKAYIYFSFKGKVGHRSFSYLGFLKIIQKKKPYILLTFKDVVFKSLLFKFEVKDNLLVQENIKKKKKKINQLSEFTFIELFNMNLPFLFIVEILQGMIPNELFNPNTTFNSNNMSFSLLQNDIHYTMGFNNYFLNNIKLTHHITEENIMIDIDNKLNQKRIYPRQLIISDIANKSKITIKIKKTYFYEK